MSNLTSDGLFQVGEIVILAVTIVNPVNIGQEREILAQPKPHKWFSRPGRTVDPGCYWLRKPDGGYAQAYPWQLRRKRPPQHKQGLEREKEREHV